MESKYYTPIIEEFHIGFEYELLKKVSRYDNHWRFEILKKIFVPTKANRDFDWIRLQIDLEDKEIRVKYLDKEDIESLGWKHIGGKSVAQAEQIYIKGNCDLRYSEFGNNLKIERKDMIRDGSGNFKSYYTIFEGKIKNKSELSKLMKQLNITNG